MNPKTLNNIMLLKRFREQFLFGRFETIDFETEILNRMKQTDCNNIDILNGWKRQLKFGIVDDIDFKKIIINQFEGETK